jgi:hypothetical protein
MTPVTTGQVASQPFLCKKQKPGRKEFPAGLHCRLVRTRRCVLSAIQNEAAAFCQYRRKNLTVCYAPDATRNVMPIGSWHDSPQSQCENSEERLSARNGSDFAPLNKPIGCPCQVISSQKRIFSTG